MVAEVAELEGTQTLQASTADSGRKVRIERFRKALLVLKVTVLLLSAAQVAGCVVTHVIELVLKKPFHHPKQPIHYPAVSTIDSKDRQIQAMTRLFTELSAVVPVWMAVASDLL